MGKHATHPVRLEKLARRLTRAFVSFCATCLTTIVHAAVFPMPSPGSNMIGALQTITIANPDLTLLDIARRFDLGHHEITAANPTVSVWTPKVGDRVVIPTQFILPPRPHKGIVINIPQRRLFYFIDESDDKPAEVITFPLSTSRPGWKTPLGKTRIVGKHCNPAWIVPKSIREERLRDGEPNFPTYFPPGPDNPMGMLALQTGFSSIFIHGTNEPWGIGMRTSHGCLHLYPEDAAYLFPRVRPGTPVRIIDQPHTVGVHDGALYMSSSEPMGEYSRKRSPARAVDALLPYIRKQSADAPAHGEIDWRRAFTVAAEQRYLPVPISRSAPALEQIIESIDAKPYAEEPYDSSANNAALPMGESQDVALLCKVSN